MKNLNVKDLGPIKGADVTFGDLTLLVGPQASGKSIFLQLLKLLIDKNDIRNTFEQYSFTWGKNTDDTLELYFGEGMQNIWTGESQVFLDGRKHTRDFVKAKSGERYKEAAPSIFYIPAQRILSITDGRPKTFTEFDVSSVPFVLKYFSEKLRQFLQKDFSTQNDIFPLKQRLKEPLRQSFDDSIFHHGKVYIDDSTGQRKLKMEMGQANIPFMTWSAGQKEFMPLLLSFYWLCPPSKISIRDKLKYVIIEEPEMGLHPQAIKSVILQIIDLMSRGYKVIVSTHSPVFLEFAWAVNYLKKTKAKGSILFDLFEMEKSPPVSKAFNDLFMKEIVTYYFNRTPDGVVVKDISTLDAGDENSAVSEWGGLSTFATKAGELVSNNAE